MSYRMGKRIIFYSSVRDKSLFNTQKFYQIDIFILKDLGYNVILSNKIMDAFKFWKYDIVFGYFFRYSFFFILIAKIFGKQSYLTGGIDALDLNYAGKKAYYIQKFFFKLCYRIATKCIIVSKEDLKHVEKIVGNNKSRITYSEHSIDTSVFTGGKKLSDKERNFVTVGWQGTEGNVKRKGIDKALILFSSLKQKQEFANSKILIIGRNGSGTPFVQRLIEKLGLKDSAIIIGEVSEEEKIAYLKNNKYYFQLSEYEGFGIAALEALIAGDIVIHSGKGGLNNHIYDNHIKVNIDNDMTSQSEVVYQQLINIDKVAIEKTALDCLQYYDNCRRKNDFKRIMDIPYNNA